MNERYKRAKDLFLQVCELPPAERSAVLDRECAGDAALRADVESLVQHHVEAHDPAEAATAASRSPATTSQQTRIGPYRVHHEIGRGGMGVVYLAVRDDDQFKRRVALKVLKRGMDTEDVLKRFELERQLLAAMNHPNIARLYDGGQTDDGRPFFVMEFVEGLPLDEYCDVHRLHIDERLELFRTVCSAVHYAHQNLVVHRDLKPGNIIVGKDGVPKLLDFGIAKVINPEFSLIQGDPTAPEFRVMTPEYASPEQVRGTPITTASDVYSLGVILYELVSGHRPYQIKSRVRAELERIICDEEPAKPSTAISKVEEVGDPRANTTTSTKTVTPESVARTRESVPNRLRRRLSGDIDNIVLMAMRKEPQRRYKSAEELSSDLHRHLTGMPVIARNDTLGYRAWKFVRRNRGSVAAAAVIALLLLGGLVSTMIQRAEAIRQRNIAEDERTTAQLERDNFKKLYEASVTALDQSSGEFNKSIQSLVSAVSARETLLDIADRFYDGLVKATGDHSALRDFRARIHEQRGMLLGSLRGSNFRMPEEALKSYDQALPIREALLAEAPNDPQALARLARCIVGRGDAYQLLSKFDDALAQYGRAMALLAPHLRPTSIDDDDVTRYYGMAVLSGADVLVRQGKVDEAVETYTREFARREAIASQNPTDATSLRDTAIAARRISDSLRTNRKPDDGLKFAEIALVMDERCLALRPNSDRHKRDVVSAHRQVALCLLDTGETDDAIDHLEKGLAIAQSLMESAASAETGEARIPLTTASILQSLGIALRKDGRPDEALERLRQGITTIEPFASPKRDDVAAQRTFAYLHYFAGKTMLEDQQDDNGLEHLRSCRSVLLNLSEASLSTGDDRALLEDIDLILNRQSRAVP